MRRPFAFPAGGFPYRPISTRFSGMSESKAMILGVSGLVVVGAAVVLAGLGSGRYPFGLPWWVGILIGMVGATVFAFILGGFDPRTGHGAILIAPKNAGFFIGGLADLQEMLPPDQVPEKQASTGPLPSARIHAPDDAS